MRKLIAALSICITLFVISSCTNYRYVTEKKGSKIIIDKHYEKNKRKLKEIYKKADDTSFYHEKYNEAGMLISVERVEDTVDNFNIGEAKYYYDSGKIKMIKHFDKDGFFDGELLVYYPNGAIKRKEVYDNFNLIESQCYDSLGNKIPYTPFFKEIEFDLGEIAQHIKYPETLQKQGIEEIVSISLLIDKKGNPVIACYDSLNSIEFVVNSIDAVLKCNCLKPAYENDEPISAWLSVPFVFKLK